MTTKFEQARGRPKPPRIRSYAYTKYQDTHNTVGVWRLNPRTWVTETPTVNLFEYHPTWEQAIVWVGEQVKCAKSLQLERK